MQSSETRKKDMRIENKDKKQRTFIISHPQRRFSVRLKEACRKRKEVDTQSSTAITAVEVLIYVDSFPLKVLLRTGKAFVYRTFFIISFPSRYNFLLS